MDGNIPCLWMKWIGGFFESTNSFFASTPWKSVKMFRVAWLGINFYDSHDFQPKIVYTFKLSVLSELHTSKKKPEKICDADSYNTQACGWYIKNSTFVWKVLCILNDEYSVMLLCLHMCAESVSSTMTKVEMAKDIYFEIWIIFHIWCAKRFAICIGQIQSKLLYGLVIYEPDGL